MGTLAEEASGWRTRFADLLADYPDAGEELDLLVRQIRVALTENAGQHSIAAGRDVNVTAGRGAIAAGVIHGDAIGVYQAAPRPEAARLPVRLTPRPSLAGRGRLLARLHALLTSGEPPQVVVLGGLAGVGKTSLAVEYAHEHLAETGLAWQIPAEEPAGLTAGMAELAGQLGARDIGGQQDPVASAHAVLAALPAQWILVRQCARCPVNSEIPAPGGMGPC